MTDFELWLRSHRNLRPSTAALYAKCIRRTRGILGHDPKIPDTGAVRDAVVGLSEASRRNILQALEHWFDYSGTPYYIENKPRGRNRAPTYLSEEKVAELLASDMTLEERALLSLLYYGAMRLQEAIAIAWPDVWFDEGRILIREGKGGKRDEVFVTAACTDVLRQLREFQMFHRVCEHEYIFHRVRFVDGRPTTAGPCAPLSKSQAYEIVVRAGERGGIPLHPHELRHSCATHMVNRGAPLPFVQRHLRHADPSSTLIYFHMNTKAQREAIGKFVPDLSGGGSE